MLHKEANFLRIKINVGLVARYMKATKNDVPKQAQHPSQESRAQTTSDANATGFAQKKKKEDKLKNLMSSKALSLGEANGVTAEFIVQQTSE